MILAALVRAPCGVDSAREIQAPNFQFERSLRILLAETNTAASEIFDWNIALANTGGDRRLLQELVEIYLAEAPNLINAIEQAIQGRNLDQLHRAAHTLKGALLTLATNEATTAAANLESFAQ